MLLMGFDDGSNLWKFNNTFKGFKNMKFSLLIRTVWAVVVLVVRQFLGVRIFLHFVALSGKFVFLYCLFPILFVTQVMIMQLVRGLHSFHMLMLKAWKMVLMCVNYLTFR